MVSKKGPLLALVVMALAALSNAEIVTSEVVMPKENSRNISLSEPISQLLDLFSTTRLANNWSSINDMLSRNCSSDMELYLQGLSDHVIWAMKST